jgi:Ni,Fe-hydrogenase III small subunit
VVALGDCGCTGGIFGESYASSGRVSNVIPVDVAVPGCPPSPTRILEGILAALARSPLNKTVNATDAHANDTELPPR